MHTSRLLKTQIFINKKKLLTTESNGPCLNLSWNENAKGFGESPGPLINPLYSYYSKSLVKEKLLSILFVNKQYYLTLSIWTLFNRIKKKPKIQHKQ